MRLWGNLMIKNKRLKFGGRINREQEVSFSFNGKKYKGVAGDTLASALLANGVNVVGRSFKYSRPRGIVGHGMEEPNGIIQFLGDDASGNNLITTVIIKEGLEARSVNCWPSAEFDFGALIQVFSRFIPAGFYYKTFKWPTWHLFEPFIRKAAGLARAPVAPPKEGHFESRNAHVDILIVGAGPSGLMAALVAARAGARIIIADQNCEPGGSLLDQNLKINGQAGLDWVQDVVSELTSLENVTHLQNSTVWAYREHNLLIINQRITETPSIIERSWRVRATQVLIATGAIERSIVFPNNDRPGVMMASAIQAYINRYAVLPGEKVVLFTNNDSAYSVALDVLNAGGHVVAVVDSRKDIPEHAIKKIPNVTVFSDSVVAKVNGYKRVKSVEIMSSSTKTIVTMPCDLVGHSGGWNPTVHLHSQARGSLRYVLNLAAFIPDKSIQKSFCIGAASGKLALDEALSSGLEVSKQALKEIGLKEIHTEAPNSTLEKYSIEPLWQVGVPKKFGKSFLDIQNDVTTDDVDLAILEGYSNVEHVKRLHHRWHGL